MNINEYKISGILEDYVMGLLSASEMRQVEQYAQEYPEIKAELAALENALADYANLHAIPPPASLRAKIVNTVGTSNTITSPTPANTSILKTMLGVASMLFLLSGLYSLYLFSQNNQLKEKLEENKVAYNDSVIALANANEQLTICNEKVELLRPFHVTILRESEDNPQAIAAVYWNEKEEKARFISNIQAPPSGKQYELWTLNDKGTPINMGIVQTNLEDLTEVDFIEKPAMFAISLEDIGSAKETPTQVYIAGKINPTI